VLRRHVAGRWLDVDEHRSSAEPRHRRRGRKERIAGEQHFVAGANFAGHQRQQQGIASRCAAHGVLHLTQAREVVLELAAIGPEDEPPRFTNAVEGAGDFVPQSGSLAPHVEQRHTNGGSRGGIVRPRCGHEPLRWFEASERAAAKAARPPAGLSCQGRSRTVGFFAPTVKTVPACWHFDKTALRQARDEASVRMFLADQRLRHRISRPGGPLPWGRAAGTAQRSHRATAPDRAEQSIRHPRAPCRRCSVSLPAHG